MLRFSTIAILLAAIVACSSNNYNPTTFAYEYHAERMKERPKAVMISPINYGNPSRHYLARHESTIDHTTRDFLKKQDIRTLSNKSFLSFWKKSEIEYGNTFNPSTGEKTATFRLALEQTLNNVFSQHPELDAVIFTDIIEVPVPNTTSLKKSLEWHGIQRKIKVEGIDDWATDDLKMSQTLDGISIEIHIFNRDLQLVHHSIGGIQIAQSLKVTNKKARFARRNDLLAAEDDINDGLVLAFHPWISMKNYPGKEH